MNMKTTLWLFLRDHWRPRFASVGLALFFCVSAFGQPGTNSTTPAIFSFSPGSGPLGTAVVVVGTNFGATAAGNVVYFGAVRATVTAASRTALTVTVPLGATYAPPCVTVGGLTACASCPLVVTFPSP